VLGADETRNDAIYDFLDVHIFSVGAFEPRNGALLGFPVPTRGRPEQQDCAAA
jgi:hypothetical protein